jgi:hypothetical protein
MSNINTEGLPPEMQARIAEIIEKAKANAVTPGTPGLNAPVPGVVPQPPAPVVRPPSLMDHVIALRQEVADMRNEVANMTQQVTAVGQVSEAVGNAVGQMYQMFQQQTTLTDSGATYSENFQEYASDEDY